MNGKRHKGLFLAILEAIEKDTALGAVAIKRPLDAFEGFDEEQVMLHYRLLIEEKFVDGDYDPRGGTICVKRMTWKGYDYLDDLRGLRASGVI